MDTVPYVDGAHSGSGQLLGTDDRVAPGVAILMIGALAAASWALVISIGWALLSVWSAS